MTGRTAFWLLAALGVAIVAGTFAALPRTVAIHFDAGGRANGWSPPAAYALFLAAFGVGMPLAVVGLVEVLARRAPGWINLPHRQIWLAQPHRAQALARVREQMWWLACLLLLSAIVAHLAVIRANLSQPPRLPLAAALLTIGVPLAGLAVWTVRWYRLFSPPPRSRS